MTADGAQAHASLRLTNEMAICAEGGRQPCVRELAVGKGDQRLARLSNELCECALFRSLWSHRRSTTCIALRFGHGMDTGTGEKWGAAEYEQDKAQEEQQGRGRAQAAVVNVTDAER
jgi:hypothetical protein